VKLGSPTVKRVLRGQLCTGCGLCASVASDAIRMEDVESGYARPRQYGPVSAAEERLIAAACPGAIVEPWSTTEVHPHWGPFRQVMTGHAQDPQVRFEGSSGGAISALLIHALETGLVDRVIHIAADPERPTRNVLMVSHSRSEVLTSAGSRYTASSPLAQIEGALASPGRAAFVGKPCDVSALRRLAHIDPRVGERFPIMLSFFCGGTPSHRGVERILAAMGLQQTEVVAFRYRGQGWPGTTAAVTADGGVGEMSYEDSWGGYLSKEVQFRCKICPDAVGGSADIACADAWYGGESGYPTFEELDGRSLIISRSKAGDELLRSAMASGALVAEDLAISEIELMQPSQARRKRLVLARIAALVATLQPRPRMAGLQLTRAAMGARPSELAFNFLGALRRIVLNRR
jgi:coenzyme F420 hydrogenase subunit beta